MSDSPIFFSVKTISGEPRLLRVDRVIELRPRKGRGSLLHYKQGEGVWSSGSWYELKNSFDEIEQLLNGHG